MNQASSKVRHVVGVMTGTSIDGIDAALVRIGGVGLDMAATLVDRVSHPLPVDLGTRLRAAAEQTPMTAGEFARLAWEFGRLHAIVIDDLVRETPESPDLICIHGQTVFHQPPISWQLVNAAPIAQRFSWPVVSDLRQADLAAGGQGAPITPIADWILFRDARQSQAIINLGGFCNVTILPKRQIAPAAATPPAAPSTAELQQIRGFDVCACNQVLDAVAREALGEPFDVDGAAASRGRAKPQAAAALLQILTKQRGGRRSLGTGDEAVQWVRHQITCGLAPSDLAASAVDAIAGCISAAVGEHQVQQLIVAGGGARHLALVEAIASQSRRAVRTSDDLGVPIEARESMAFAILGALCADGVPITLPQVTGCREPAPVAGVWNVPFGRRGLPPRG